MTHQLVRLALGSVLVLSAATAGAEAPKRVVLLPEYVLFGRIQKPMAAIDVGRVPPKLSLTELREHFLDRVGTAASHDPY